MLITRLGFGLWGFGFKKVSTTQPKNLKKYNTQQSAQQQLDSKPKIQNPKQTKHSSTNKTLHYT
jgi:hypothetical protein